MKDVSTHASSRSFDISRNLLEGKEASESVKLCSVASSACSDSVGPSTRKRRAVRRVSSLPLQVPQPLLLLVQQGRAELTDVEPIWRDDMAPPLSFEIDGQPDRNSRLLWWSKGTVDSLNRIAEGTKGQLDV